MVCSGPEKQSDILYSPGVSLKSLHFENIIKKKPPVAWFEIHPENLKSGTTFSYVEKIRQDYLLSFHSVGLSLGSDPFNHQHLLFLKEFHDHLAPALFSTHLSWNYREGIYMNDLLPLPYNDEVFNLVKRNILKTQDVIGHAILVENPATYIDCPGTIYEESDFMIRLCRETGCKILLDLNNIYVNAINGGFDPYPYVKKMILAGCVGEMHLAGHEARIFEGQTEAILLDTHGGPVSAPVWDLYRYALSLSQAMIPTLIEWDANVPPLDVLMAEQQKAKKFMEDVYGPAKISETV